MAGSDFYVSYAWKDVGERGIVDKLDAVWEKRFGFKLKRDNREIGYAQSIRAYMDRLAAGSHIILVLSDNYLKSDYCMHELLGIFESKNFRERVSPILLEGTRIDRPEDQAGYREFWEEQFETLDARVRGLRDRANSGPLIDQLNGRQKCKDAVLQLLRELGDMNALTKDIHINTDFEALLNRISPAVIAVAQRLQVSGAARSPQSQHDFDEKIRKEIATLLCKPSMSGFAKTLRRKLDAEEVRTDSEPASESTEAIVNVIMAQWWRPQDALGMIIKLTEATQAHLQSLRERGESPRQTDFLWQALKRVMGYLATCAVARDWLSRNQHGRSTYYEIPLERLAGIEVASASLAGVPASFELTNDGDVKPPYHLAIDETRAMSPETYVPETGWRKQETVEQIEVIVYTEVLRGHGRKTKLSKVDRDELNTELKINREDPDNNRHFVLPVAKDQQSHPLLNPEIAAELKDRLPELPIVRFGADEKDPVLIVPEGTLVAYIRHFLRLIKQADSHP